MAAIAAGFKWQQLFNRKIKQDDAGYSSDVSHESNEINDEKPKDYAKLDIFHRAVYPIMLFAQCFAIMPLTGIWQSNPARIRFRLKSLPMLATLIFLAGNTLLTLGMLKYLIHIGINPKNYVGQVFFACAQFASILFIQLANNWPPLIRDWTRLELAFTKPSYKLLECNLLQRVRKPALIILVMSFVEHALYQAASIVDYRKHLELCMRARNISADGSFDTFMMVNYEFAFQFIPFSRYTAIYVLLVNGAATFVWNYMDLFIMMISRGLAYRFAQISMRIRQLEHKEQVPEATFIEIREHYVQMCELLERVDDALSTIILLSCANNLYFVCCQLLNIFNKLRWTISYVYFWYSMLYLLGRTACVFLTAATINDESKNALSMLRRVSNRNWCIEVERLIFQMTTETVALTGKKFYFLTRRLFFAMAGTIVTYELVLLQFDEPNRSQGLQPLCA